MCYKETVCLPEQEDNVRNVYKSVAVLHIISLVVDGSTIQFSYISEYRGNLSSLEHYETWELSTVITPRVITQGDM